MTNAQGVGEGVLKVSARIAYAMLTPLGFILQCMLQWWCASSLGVGTISQFVAACALICLHTFIGLMVALQPLVARTAAGNPQPSPSDAIKVALAVPIWYGSIGALLVVGFASGFHYAHHGRVMAISTVCGLLIHLIGAGLPAVLLELHYARESRRRSRS